MSERLATLPDRAAARKIGAGAVGQCVGCPLIELCATKPVPPCENDDNVFTPEIGGDAEPTAKVSYRKELLDDSLPRVLAKPKRKPLPHIPNMLKEQKQQKPAAVPRKQPPQTLQNKNQDKRRKPHHAETAGEILADVFAALIGVNSLRKRVR